MRVLSKIRNEQKEHYTEIENIPYFIDSEEHIAFHIMTYLDLGQIIVNDKKAVCHSLTGRLFIFLP